MADDTMFREWAIVELMGHRRMAGLVTEQQVAGAAFLRVDVYEKGDGPAAATQLYSPAAVYCITPTTEDIARSVGSHHMPQPVTRWQLAPSLVVDIEDDEDDDDYERDD